MIGPLKSKNGGSQFFSRVRIPENRGAPVVTTRCNFRSVRREGYRIHSLRVSVELLQQLSRIDVPKPHFGVFACRSHAFSIG